MIHKNKGRIWKFMSLSLVMLLGAHFMNLQAQVFAQGSDEISATFEEVISKDQSSVTVIAKIEEKEGQYIDTIIMPNLVEIPQESFRKDEKNRIVLDYSTKNNETLTYRVTYRHLQVDREALIPKNSEFTYTVQGLETPDKEDAISSEKNIIVEMDDMMQHKNINGDSFPGINYEDQNMFVGDDINVKAKENLRLYSVNYSNPASPNPVVLNVDQEIALGNLTIDTSGVNPNVPGKYKIKYVFMTTVTVGNNHDIYIYRVERTIFIHGKLTVEYQRRDPNHPDVIKDVKDIQANVGDEIDALNGVYVTYDFVNSNGIIEKKRIPATSPNPSAKHLTSDIATTIAVKVEKTVTISWSQNERTYEIHEHVSDCVSVDFYEFPTITIKNKSILANKGTSLAELMNKMEISAFIKTPSGEENLINNVTIRGKDEELDMDRIGEYDAQAVLVSPYQTTFGNVDEVTSDVSIAILGSVTVKAMDVNVVEGDTIDILKDVIIIDDLNQRVKPTMKHVKSITVPGDMDGHNIKTTQPGAYEIVYQVIDKQGTIVEFIRTVNVHGKLTIEGTNAIYKFASEVIGENETGTYKPDVVSAYYMDATNKRIDVNVKHDQELVIHHDKPIKKDLIYNIEHPINKTSTSITLPVHIFSNPEWEGIKPIHIKVHQEVNVAEYVWLTYKKINNDGEEILVKVDCTKQSFTSAYPTRKSLPLVMHVEDHGAKWNKETSVMLYVSGYPQFKSTSKIWQDGHISITSGTMDLQQIIAALDVTAFVNHADGTIEDITKNIKYSGFIDFHKPGTYHLTMLVEDFMGYQVHKEIEIQVNTPKPAEDVKHDEDKMIPFAPPPIQLNKKTPNSYVIVTKEIPSSGIQGTITNEFLSSYVFVTTKDGKRVHISFISNDIRNKPGIYNVEIRLPDGTIKTIPTQVIEDPKQPNKENKENKRGHATSYSDWVMMILLLFYIVVEIILLEKRRRENMLLARGNACE